MDRSSIVGIWRRHAAWREGAIAVGLGLMSCALVYRMLGMHRGDISLPDRDADALGIYMVVKGMQQHGWYTPNPSLGYPSGQDLAAYPNLDLVHLLTLKFFSLLLDNPYGPVRLFDFWAFFAVAAVGYLVLRYAGVRILIAAPLALSLSVAPWHFQRLTGHIFLANYAPLLVGIFMALFTLRSIRGRRSDPTRRRFILALALLTLCGFIIAGGGLYWLFACGIVLGLIVLPALVANPSWRSLAYAAAALLPAPIFAAAWLKLQVWTSTYPVVVKSFARQMVESELYGGSVATLFLPSPRSGIAHAAEIRNDYDKWTHIAANWESGPWNSMLGILAVTVSLLLLLALTSTLWRDPAPRALAAVRRVVESPRDEGWYTLFITSVLMFAVTAIGTLTMIFLFQEIRAWGRFFILIIILATIILGLALTAMSRLRSGPWLAVGIAIALGLAFVADQVRGNYRGNFVTTPYIAADALAFDRAVEATTPDGCPILDLPVMPWPENGPIGGMKDYDPLWLYLESTNLRFTYGVPKFQPEALWQDQFAKPLSPELLEIARKAGICGIAVDTYGYGGADVPDVQSMRYLVGGTPLYSPSRRWMFLRI